MNEPVRKDRSPTFSALKAAVIVHGRAHYKPLKTEIRKMKNLHAVALGAKVVKPGKVPPRPGAADKRKPPLLRAGPRSRPRKTKN